VERRERAKARAEQSRAKLSERLASLQQAVLQPALGALRETSPELEKKLTEEVAPQLQRGVSSAVQATQRSLQEAEPPLRQLAGQLDTLKQSTVEAGKQQLVPILKDGVQTANEALQRALQPLTDQIEDALDWLGAPTALKTALARASWVLLLPLLFTLLEALKPVLLPALAALVVLLGLGAASKLSLQFPQLGEPLDIFLKASAFVGGTVLVVSTLRSAALFLSGAREPARRRRLKAKGDAEELGEEERRRTLVRRIEERRRRRRL